MTTYTGAEFEPVFFERMAEWFKGGKRGPDPRYQIEWRHCSACNWGAWAFSNTSFNQDEFEFQWKPAKPRTVTIDGVELVAPEREAPAVGTTYFAIYSDGEIAQLVWRDWESDKTILKNGNVFLTREAAQAMADAQRRQRTGET